MEWRFDDITLSRMQIRLHLTHDVTPPIQFSISPLYHVHDVYYIKMITLDYSISIEKTLAGREYQSIGSIYPSTDRSFPIYMLNFGLCIFSIINNVTEMKSIRTVYDKSKTIRIRRENPPGVGWSGLGGGYAIFKQNKTVFIWFICFPSRILSFVIILRLKLFPVNLGAISSRDSENLKGLRRAYIRVHSKGLSSSSTFRNFNDDDVFDILSGVDR